MNKSEYRLNVGHIVNIYTDVVFALERNEEKLKKAGLAVWPFAHLTILHPKTIPFTLDKGEVKHRAYYSAGSYAICVLGDAPDSEMLSAITDAINDLIDGQSMGVVEIEHLPCIQPDWTTTKLIGMLEGIAERNSAREQEYLKNC